MVQQDSPFTARKPEKVGAEGVAAAADHQWLTDPKHRYEELCELGKSGRGRLSPMEDTELWRLASIMLERRGLEATAECERLADQLEREHRPKGAADWRRVAAAVDELLRGLEKGERVH